MGMRAPVTGGADFEKPQPGTYTGVCNGVYVCGKQEGYQGGRPQQKVLLTFELHKRRGPAVDKRGNIFECSTTVTNVTNVKSALINRFAGPMRGNAYTDAEIKAMAAAGGYDPENLLGQPIKIVLAAGKTGAPFIQSTAPLDPEEDEVPEQVTSDVYWDYAMAGEVPRRCAWLWAKSLDNPARTGQAANVGAVAAPEAYETPEDSPF